MSTAEWTIDPDALEEIFAHARETNPKECCGILLGQARAIGAAVRAGNLADAEDRFLIDPRDHIAARRHARERGQDVLGFYHSHPRSHAFPSKIDVAESGYEECVHLIVGMRGDEPEARLYRWRDGEIEELTFA